MTTILILAAVLASCMYGVFNIDEAYKNDFDE